MERFLNVVFAVRFRDHVKNLWRETLKEALMPGSDPSACTRAIQCLKAITFKEWENLNFWREVITPSIPSLLKIILVQDLHRDSKTIARELVEFSLTAGTEDSGLSRAHFFCCFSYIRNSIYDPTTAKFNAELVDGLPNLITEITTGEGRQIALSWVQSCEL